MFKEISDIEKVLDIIILKSKEILKISEEIKVLAENIKSKTCQEDAVNKSLAIRKELANLFILRSSIEDACKSLKKTFDSLKK